ncbi:MAG: phosphatase PAP2 family protein [Dehalococcoidia bacterium]|nr:phosphatase PAP2 family protein [Dehalococcoidia bacterium]
MRALPAPLKLWFLLLGGFIVLSVFAAAYDRFPADLWLMHRFQDIESPTFAEALDRAAEMVNGWELMAVLAAGAVLLLLARQWLGALLLLVSPSAGLLNIAVKEIVGRPRPSPELVSFTTGSQSLAFPSGHADSAIVIYGLLFYLITVFVSQPALRLLGQAVCLWVILFTGMQRVYIGVHWPSDVLGGYYLGGLVLAALIGLHHRLRSAPEAVTDSAPPRY